MNTMPIAKHIYARAARDRILDLLGLGETYPLRDVTVEEEQLTVDFEAPSRFEIEPAQEDVDYALYEHGAPVQSPGATRVGETVTLGGPVITDDRVFQIRAVKIDRLERFTFLLDTAKIKVGLNTSLRAWISGGSLLNPSSSGDLDPRVTDYGTTVGVTVEHAQALVRYQLIYPGPGGATVSMPLTDEVPVNGNDLTLTTGTVTEDTQIDIHMTRTFDPGEGRKNLEGYLEQQPHAKSPPPWNFLKLPLAVRANPALLVSIQGASMDGSPLVEPLGTVTITLASSQTSVEYSVYARPLLDADFELAPPPPGAPALLPPITVPASLDVLKHDVLVHDPPRPDPWTTQDGYVLHGPPTAGNGGDLTLSIGPFESDTVFVIKGRKTHQGGQTALQLAHALVALPRPKPVPPLSLVLVLSQSGQLSVSGGQRGVFYHFRRIGQTNEIGLPAYFHRLDEADPQQNRGIGQLRIETDFAVARDPDDPNAPQTDPAYRPVPDPVVDLTNVPPPGEDSVNVMAVHARTGVGWVASQTFPMTRQ